MGGTAGVLLYLACEQIGSSLLAIKGAMIALFFWFIFKLYTTAFIEGRFVDTRAFDTYFSHLICTITYGLLLGLAFRFTLFRKTEKAEISE